MLIQNQYDGRFYEVPDFAGYDEYEGPGYHGLGLPFFAPLAAKIGARFLPKALPFARRFLRRFRRRFPRIPGVPFAPGLPFPGGGPPIPRTLLSTNVARKVVAMLRQQGLQVTPAGPFGPAPGPQPGPPPGPDPGTAPPDAQPQPGVGEYPYDPQAAGSEEFDPYAQEYPETYPYQDPYQYPYARTSSWRRFSRWFPGRRAGYWGRRSSNWPRQPGAGRWMGARANVMRRYPHARVRRSAPVQARPVYRGRR